MSILDPKPLLPGALDAKTTDLINGTGTATRGALNATYATSGGLLPPPLANVTVTAAGTTPLAIEVFGGYVWGYTTSPSNIYRSADNGATWTLYCPTPDGDSVMRLIPTSDGEVILATPNGIRRSTGWSGGSPTWTVKVTPNASARFFQFGVDGNGTKFIAAQYSSTLRADSRYAHISTDSGNTWTQVWDSVARFGQAAADGSHIHGAAYDKWADRFYLAEGHADAGAVAGIYHSTNNGSTWAIASGMVNDPSPTVIVATDDGLTCGSDHGDAGVWGVLRHTDPTREVIKRTWAWRTGIPGVVGFGVRGYRDPATGVVYIGYRVAASTVTPIITASTAARATGIYTTTALSITPPALSAPTTATTGGTLAAATYYYKATYTNANEETTGSNEISQVTTGAASTVTFTIGAAPTGATGTKIYRSTAAGAEVLLDTLTTTPTTYTDNGSKTPGTATVPTHSADDIQQAIVAPDGRFIAHGLIKGATRIISATLGKVGALDYIDAGGVRGGTAAGDSVAAGVDSEAVGLRGVALGVNAASDGQDSVVIGHGATAAGAYSTAMGAGSKGGFDSVVLGAAATIKTFGTGVVIGRSAEANNSGVVAVGHSAKSQVDGVAVGRAAEANGVESVALGSLAVAWHQDAVALGNGTGTKSTNQVAIGPRHIALTELAADAPAPEANDAYLFARDNGLGKTQLCVRFPTGVVAVLATEP